MKKIIILLAIVSLTSCSVTFDEKGDPVYGLDQASIDALTRKANEALRAATK